MSSTSNKTYRALSFPYFKEVFLLIDRVCNELGVEYYLIGAQARNIHLLESGIIPIKVSPLEGIVILKLISFNENPVRKKDLDDINEILRNYFDINSERFYEHHLDLVDEIEADEFTQLAGARLLGRDMKKILRQSEKLSQTIAGVIQNELEEKTGSITQYFLSRNLAKDYEFVKNIFRQLLNGIEE